MASRRKKIVLTAVVVAVAGFFFVLSNSLIDPAMRGLPSFVNNGEVLARFTGPEYPGGPPCARIAIYLPMSQAEVEKEFDAFIAHDPDWTVRHLLTGPTAYSYSERGSDTISIGVGKGRYAIKAATCAVSGDILDSRGTTVWIQQRERPGPLLRRLLTTLRVP